MKLKNDNHFQGASHIMIIAFLPLLMVGAYFAESWIVKGMLIALIVVLFIFIWKKIFKHK